MDQTTDETTQVVHKVARIQAFVLAFVCALVGGLGLFLLTAVLLIQGGEDVGAHMQLLSHYFFGYSVTWPGSIVGLIYGGFIGGVVGWSIGMLYNLFVAIRHR